MSHILKYWNFRAKNQISLTIFEVKFFGDFHVDLPILFHGFH